MKLKETNLYFVTSEEYSGGKDTLKIAKEAVAGGVDILQMREKGKSREELDRLGKELAKECRDNGVIFIVNDDPVLAADVNADGVHLGQEDIKKYTLKETRKIMGRRGIIGISTHSIRQFVEANSQDFDYIAFGPIFETRTKDYFVGHDDVGEILDIARKPVVFIGGIDPDNIDILIGKGARNVAVIRAITQADDITGRVREFKEKLRG